MFRHFDHRFAHYVILLSATALLTMPNLGNHSLWDVDEGINAEAAREMYEGGNWITPTFNFELRTAKPALLYWVQSTSFSIFGVNEFAARLPSVLAAMLTILLVYELGRRMFGSTAALIGGLVLTSAIEFCMLAHAATPDATLLLFTMLTFFFFWLAVEKDCAWWYVPSGIAAGFAVLTKGPIGVAMPALVAICFLAWNRQLRQLWDRRVLLAIGAFLLVCLPWYVLVALETKGVWASKFLGRENLYRFLKPMENHSGPIFYHAAGVLLLFAPWSVFLGGAFWYGVRSTRGNRAPIADAPGSPEVVDNNSHSKKAHRLLLCWFTIYLVFFSIAATKLPNYVLPLYPALALLTAQFLDSWRRGSIQTARWLMPTCTIALAMVGVITILGLLVVGGAIPVPFGKMRLLSGMENWAFLGAIPMIGASIAYWYLRRGRRDAFVATCSVACVSFIACIAAFMSVAIDAHKAPRALVEKAGARQLDEEVRLAGLYYFQPSLVFYGQREVKKLDSLDQTLDFLSLPYRVYLFVPEKIWLELRHRIPIAHREVARHFDFLKNCEVLVVTNR